MRSAGVGSQEAGYYSYYPLELRHQPMARFEPVCGVVAGHLTRIEEKVMNPWSAYPQVSTPQEKLG